MNRDDQILESYMQGRPIPEISRMHGIGVRRIYQILDDNKVPKNRNYGARTKVMKALTRRHETIGRKVYDFYFDRGLTRAEAAEQLGWTVIKLRNVEEGKVDLTLFDLQDIATWRRLEVGDIANGR